MDFIIKSMRQNRSLIRLLVWFRGLLAENEIPDTLFDRLKSYIPELSESRPNIAAINKHLEYDIGYLNSREEIISIQKLSKLQNCEESQHSVLRKYRSVKIVSYQDIIELDAIRDRIYTFDINMYFDNTSYIYSLYKENADYLKEPLYYTVKLSSLVSKF